jgi:hypothetical protein
MHVFYFPYRYQNKIIQINTDILRSIGCKVSPLADVYKWQNLTNLKKVVVLNWVEDQPYLKSYGFIKSWAYFTYYFLTILFCKLTCSEIIWIKHNFKPHARDKNAWRYRLTTSLLKFVKAKQLAHEDYYDSTYLPHPLYLDDEELKRFSTKFVEPMDIKVAFFGHVKKYKGLHKTLLHWSKDIPLEIRGKFESEEYKKQILDTINSRNLNVIVKDGYVSDEDLETLLLQTTHVLLPHEDNSMISSGSFYHAISYGCNVLALESDFSKHKASKHRFVTTSDIEKLTLECLERNYVSKQRVILDSLAVYSRETLTTYWKNLLSVS